MSARCSQHVATIDDKPEAIVVSCPSCGYTNLFRDLFSASWASTWRSQYCANCGQRSFQNFVGPTRRYKRFNICWACDSNVHKYGRGLDYNGRCQGCGKACDGTDVVKWVRIGGGLGGAKMDEVVDWDEERKRWIRTNRKIVNKVRVCEVCGKVCKSRSGLMTHARSCKGEKKEKYRMKRVEVETRPCVDV